MKNKNIHIFLSLVEESQITETAIMSIDGVLPDKGFLGEDDIFSKASSTEKKTANISGITFKEIGQAIYNSPTIRSLAAVGVVALTGLVVLVMIGGLATPPGWVIGAAAVTIFALSMVFQKDKVPLDFGSTSRLIWRDQFNEIPLEGGATKGKIWLGASPNKLSQEVRELFNRTGEKGVRALLEVNDAWELEPRGFSIPISKHNVGLAEDQVSWIEQKDHTPLDVEKMKGAAQFIHEKVSKGENIYVHCLGGKGRSAMAVAAYLIRYEKKTIKEAADLIKLHRKQSTIHKENKRSMLEAFASWSEKNPP